MPLRLIEAEAILDKYTAQFPELFKNGWTFEWNKSQKHLGQCWYYQKKIALSVHVISSTSSAEFEDTILHEIAHALVGPNHGHDEIWQTKAREIGCNGKTCGEMDVDKGRGLSKAEAPKKKHLAPLTKKCPTCGHAVYETSTIDLPSGKWARLVCGHLIKQTQYTGVSPEFWESSQGHKPFPYQVTGINFIGKSGGRCLIADEPGLGKTIQALGFLKFWPEEACPVLWVCKSSLLIQALRESQEWLGPTYFGQVITHSRFAPIPGLKMYFVSMDLLKNIKPEKIEALGIKTIIADEIQHFKNPDSIRTQELRALVSKVDHVIFLSGTPWKNRASEYFPALNMLAPEKFPSFAMFQKQWVNYDLDTTTGKYREGGISDIPRFREFTKDFVIRRLRDDVLPDLPKINRSTRFVEFDKIYGESYEKAESRVAAQIKQLMLEGRPMNSIMGDLMNLKHLVGIAKIDVAIDDCEEFLLNAPVERKITLFHHHIEVGDKIERELQKKGIKVLRLTGGLDAYKRQEIVDKFKLPQHRVLVASQLAAGEGLNLQFCTDAIMVERQWNPANEEQCELRFSRPDDGSEGAKLTRELGSIKIPYLIVPDSVDDYLTQIVERKRANFKKSMNPGQEHIQWEEADIIKELAEMIVKKRQKRVA